MSQDLWRKKIKTNPRWALRAALRIHQQQTREEQVFSATLESNGVGFNSHDSPIICPIVERYLRTGEVTGRGYYQLQKRMPKYVKQLWRLVHE